MDKMDKYGMDLEKVNIERLKEIFPECVTDGKVNFDALRTILGDDVETSGEKYSFNWVGKSDAMKIALMPSTGTLRPCKDKSKDWDKTENLYIEGDNLEVLKTLEKTYHNQIKMIYIDPPYNTGKDFVYHDDFHDNVSNYLENSAQAFRTNPETAGRFHTDWLNMMYPRLKIAREMLKDEGVIFISIDDNELMNITKICDEIFGENNKIALFTILSNPRGSQNSTFVSSIHEYILVYAKDIDCAEINGIIQTDDIVSEFNQIDEKGEKYRLIGLRKRGGAWKRADRPLMFYPIFVNPKNGAVSLEKTDEYSIEVIPKRPTGEEGRWCWGRQKFEKENHLLIGKKVNRKGEQEAWDIFKKDYLNDINGEQKTAKVKTIWLENETNYQNAKNEIKALFGNSEMFDYPKPTYIVHKLSNLVVDDNDIILDFFSGSATTAHAVMQRNAEDGGHRKFIMVQLPEVCSEQSEAYKAGYKTICDIGEERIRRAGAKIQEALKENGLAISMMASGVKSTKEIKDDEGETVAQLSMTGLFGTPENVEEVNEEMVNNIDVGFKVFKLDSTNIKPWDATVKYDETTLYDLQDSVVKEDRSNLDIAYEVMLKYGIFNMPLEEKEVNGKTVYSVGEGYMIISLNDEITTEDVAAIAALNPKAVVFKESGFVNDNAKMNADYTFKRLGIDNVKCI